MVKSCDFYSHRCCWFTICLIKYAVILASGEPNATNKSFDFMDIINSGTYQIQIGSITFPQLQLNAETNRSAILQE